MTFLSGPNLDSYADTGCSVLPSCLECPLSACLEEMEPRMARRTRSALRNRNLVASAHADGLTLEEAASRLRVTTRAMRRILDRHLEIFDDVGGENGSKTVPPPLGPRTC